MSLHSALVVDDSKLARITLQRLLQKHNLAVEVAESGVVALEKLKSKKPDIIFMDHLMPDIDGFEATQKIKADPSTTHIPVIMCTGKEDNDNYDEQARGIGASGTLSKPPQADQLALILAAAQTGEQLVTSTPMSDETKVRSIAAGTTIEKSVAETKPTKGLELEAIFDRLKKLEQVSNHPQSLDGIQERIVTAENSLTTLQEAVISLKNETQKKPPSVEEISESVHQSLKTDLEQAFDNFKENAINIDSIKAELSSEFEAKLNNRMEALSAETGAHPEIDENALVARIMSSVETSFNDKLGSGQSNDIDEEALATKLAEDVENTLKPLFSEQLKELEQKLYSATDDAISESRKDLDEHLQDSVRDMAVTMKAAPGDSDLEGLINKIRGEVADIATHSATAAIDANLEDRLSEIKAAAKEAAPATLVSEDSAGASQQQILELFDRVAELDRRQETLLERVGELKEPQQSGATASRQSSGLVVSAIALAGAIVALAKAFGLF